MSTAGTGASGARARLLRRWVAEGERWVPVDGRSMQPTIESPAEVLVALRAKPRPGEVWAFVGPDGSIVVHRYERRIDGGYRFRGDGLATPDPRVEASLLIGRVLAVQDSRGQRRLGRQDQVIGIGRLAWRGARRGLGRGRRWAEGLISRSTQSD